MEELFDCFLFIVSVLLSAGIFLGVILLVSKIVWFFIDEYDTWIIYKKRISKDNRTKISFKRFLTFYNLNPSLWRLSGYMVEFKNSHWFYFGYMDWRRYCKWKEGCRENLEKKEKIENDYNNYYYLLNEMQKEIDKVKINTEEQIVESVANMRDIVHNLRKNF